MHIVEEDHELRDSENQRRVPIKRYKAKPRALGWVLFSVGYGGKRSSYGYLARAWAEQGLDVIVVEHVGSNLDVLRSFPQRTQKERFIEVVRRVQLADELEARPRDLIRVYEQFANEYRDVPLGLGGHSYGTYTVLACSGMKAKSLNDSVDGIPARSLLLISPQPPGMLFLDKDYEKISSPSLLVTGTEDGLLSGGADYTERLKVRDCLPEHQSFALVLNGVKHMTFAGMGLNITEQLDSVKAVTKSWWSDSLLSDAVQSGSPNFTKTLKPPALHELRGPGL